MFREPTIKLLLALATISNIGTQQLPSKELVHQGSILSGAQSRPDCGRRMKAVFISIMFQQKEVFFWILYKTAATQSLNVLFSSARPHCWW